MTEKKITLEIEGKNGYGRERDFEGKTIRIETRSVEDNFSIHADGERVHLHNYGMHLSVYPQNMFWKNFRNEDYRLSGTDLHKMRIGFKDNVHPYLERTETGWVLTFIKTNFKKG